MRRDAVPGLWTNPSGISSRQKATSFICLHPSVITTSLSGSVPKPMSVGVEPVPRPNLIIGGTASVGASYALTHAPSASRAESVVPVQTYFRMYLSVAM